MLENYVICDKGLENSCQGGLLTGYRIKMGLPYYRSIPLSCFEEFALMVDDEEVEPESITLRLGETVYSLSEILKINDISIWWNFQEKAFLEVKKEGGLSSGEHKIEIHAVIRIPYLIPTNGEFVVNYDVTNSVKMMEVNV
jgi:hypothetical protein